MNEWTDKNAEASKPDGLFLKASTQTPDGLTLSAPYATGGRFYRDEALIDQVGQDFYSVGNDMRAEVSADRVDAVLNYLMDKEDFIAVTYVDVAREQLGQHLPELEWLEAENPSIVEPVQTSLDLLHESKRRAESRSALLK